MAGPIFFFFKPSHSEIILWDETKLQKAKNVAPAEFLAQKISTKTRDLQHFQIRDKTA